MNNKSLLLIALFVALIFSSCKTLKTERPKESYLPSDLLPAYSELPLHLELDIKQLETSVNNNLNGLLYEGSNITDKDLSIKVWKSGDFTFTVTGQDAVASDSRQYQVHIKDHVRITTASLAEGREGTAYSQTLEKTSGFQNLGQSYSYSVTSGLLPAGLSLNPSSGVISGTPSAAGRSNFTIRVAESFGGSPIFYDTKELSINVSPSHQVATLSASNIAVTTATLSGITNYPDEISSRGFQYGSDANYGSVLQDDTAPVNYAYADKWGSYGSVGGQFSDPRSSAVGPDGNLYVADLENDRVQKFALDGT